jgi:hypothetical protein
MSATEGRHSTSTRISVMAPGPRHERSTSTRKAVVWLGWAGREGARRIRNKSNLPHATIQENCHDIRGRCRRPEGDERLAAKTSKLLSYRRLDEANPIRLRINALGQHTRLYKSRFSPTPGPPHVIKLRGLQSPPRLG